MRIRLNHTRFYQGFPPNLGDSTMGFLAIALDLKSQDRASIPHWLHFLVREFNLLFLQSLSRNYSLDIQVRPDLRICIPNEPKMKFLQVILK